MGVGAAIVGAGALGAAGTLGAAAMADTPKPGATFQGAPEIDLTPGLKIAEFMNLVDQGIFDPTVFKQASPLNQFISEVLSSSNFSTAKKQTFISNLRETLAQGGSLTAEEREEQFVRDIALVLQGKSTKTSTVKMRRLIEKVLAVTPYTSLDELFAADQEYRTQIAPMLRDAEAASQGNFKARLNLQTQVRGLLAGLPDASAEGIASLRGEEKARLLRDLNRNVNEQRSDVLELSNSGNFNPGRPLGDLEEFRARSTQDADLEALNRALAIIGGQQQAVGGNLALIQGGQSQTFNEALAIAQADQGFRGGSVLTTPTIPANNALPNAIAAGTSAISQGINDAVLFNTLHGAGSP